MKRVRKGGMKERRKAPDDSLKTNRKERRGISNIYKEREVGEREKKEQGKRKRIREG